MRKSNSFKSKGIEILSTEDLYQSRENLEKPHLIDFYLFVFFILKEKVNTY